MATIANKIYHIAMYSLFMTDNKTIKKTEIDLGTHILECKTAFAERGNNDDCDIITDGYFHVNCKIRNKTTGKVDGSLYFQKKLIENCCIKMHLQQLKECIDNIHASSEERKQNFIFGREKFYSTKPYIGGKLTKSSRISNEVEQQINAKYAQIIAKHEQIYKERKLLELQVKQSRKARINRFTYNKLCQKSNYQVYCLAMMDLLFTNNDTTDLGTHVLEYYPCFIEDHNNEDPYSMPNGISLAISVRLRNKQTNQIEWAGLYGKTLIPINPSSPEDAILEATKLFEEIKESSDRKKIAFILQPEAGTRNLPFRGPQLAEQEYQDVLSNFNDHNDYKDASNISLGVGFPIALMSQLDAKFEETRIPRIGPTKRKALPA